MYHIRSVINIISYHRTSTAVTEIRVLCTVLRKSLLGTRVSYEYGTVLYSYYGTVLYLSSIPHISTAARTILQRFGQQGSSKPCQIARFSRSGHSTPMAGGSAAASVGSAVTFGPAVASRAHRHCVAAVAAPGRLCVQP